MNYFDFETRSRVDIDLGVAVYAPHPSTEPMCLTYKLGADKPVQIWSPFFPDLFSPDCPTDLRSSILNDEPFEAHNAAFERYIWHFIMHKKFKWPPLKLQNLYCSMAKALALSLPKSLEKLAEALGVTVQKDTDGGKLMKLMASPQKDGSYIEDPKSLLRLFQYGITDTLVLEKVAEQMYDLSADEREMWLLDQKINDHGLLVDNDLANKMLGYSIKFQEERQAILAPLTNNVITKGTQHKRFKDYLNAEPYSMGLENTQADYIDDILENREGISPHCRQVLELKQDLGKTSVAKVSKFIAMQSFGGRIRHSLQMNMAGPGRWAGQGVQPQNLPRPSIDGDIDECIEDFDLLGYDDFKAKYPRVLNAVSSCVRGLIIPPPGHEFHDADFSSVESCVLFWLANCPVGLDIYINKGGKIYEDMAATIFNMHVSEVLKGSKERFAGKETILGCGYQMGPPALVKYAKKHGLDISLELAKKCVYGYRAKFARVVKFWEEIEAAAIKAVKNPGTTVVSGKVKWRSNRRFLAVQLPSGRKIYYYQPRLSYEEGQYGYQAKLSFMAVDSKTKQWCRRHTYGGRLVENIVQGTASCFLRHALKQADAAGYVIPLHVHDEILCEVPTGSRSIDDLVEVMRDIPAWGDGCPIDADGWVDVRYRK